MLKLIKWDILDFSHRYYMVVIGMISSYLLALLARNSAGDWNSSLMILSTLVGLIAIPALIILAAILPTRWLSRESGLLERSLPFPAWKTLASKLLLAVMINLVACFFFIMLSSLWGNSDLNNLQFFSFRNLQGVPVILLLLLLADSTFLFTYILSRSYNVFRGISAFITGLVSFFLIGSFALLTILTMTAAGTLVLPDVSTGNLLTVNGSLQVLSVTIPALTSLFLILIEFIVSSRLLEKRFQKN